MTIAPEQISALKSEAHKWSMDYEAMYGHQPSLWNFIDHLAARGLLGAVPDAELVLCEKLAHLPEHDGATGYFYYKPVKVLEPIEGLEKALHRCSANGEMKYFAPSNVMECVDGHWFIWSEEFNQYVTLSPSIKPTHWMPLPAAPEKYVE